jgi:hypothetical protein
MKKKRIDWSKVAWTEFQACAIPDDPLNNMDRPAAIFRNSRYQVTVYAREDDTFGMMAHLSFKVHDRQPHHDWRDMQRIKNEICGPEYDAVEIYPAESKLVDTANQYHLYVFRDLKLPFGFQTRLVGDGELQNAKQRPFDPDQRPADCQTPEQYQAHIDAHLAARAAAQNDGDDA